MGKQYLTESAIIFFEKSSGLSWNYPESSHLFSFAPGNPATATYWDETLGFFQWIFLSADKPQFRGGNLYLFTENLYQSVSFIASMYRENFSRDSYRDPVC